MKLNELDAGGETPPDIISDVDDIQQGFDVDKFTEMIGHTLAEKKHIINAKEVMEEISSGYQELIDDEIYDVISAMNRQLDWIADSMQWLSEKIVDRSKGYTTVLPTCTTHGNGQNGLPFLLVTWQNRLNQGQQMLIEVF